MLRKRNRQIDIPLWARNSALHYLAGSYKLSDELRYQLRRGAQGHRVDAAAISGARANADILMRCVSGPPWRPQTTSFMNRLSPEEKPRDSPPPPGLLTGPFPRPAAPMIISDCGQLKPERNPRASPSICRTRYSQPGVNDVIFHHHGPSPHSPNPPAQAVKAGREFLLAPGPLFADRLLGFRNGGVVVNELHEQGRPAMNRAAGDAQVGGWHGGSGGRHPINVKAVDWFRASPGF
jgi:hypothetical protein